MHAAKGDSFFLILDMTGAKSGSVNQAITIGTYFPP